MLVLLLVKTVVEGILVYQFFIVHIPKAKFPRNLGMGMGTPLLEKGYLGTSRVLHTHTHTHTHTHISQSQSHHTLFHISSQIINHDS